MLGHASAAMSLDIYPGLFADNLDDVADRLDQAFTNLNADQVRTTAAPVGRDTPDRMPPKARRLGMGGGAASGIRTPDLRITREGRRCWLVMAEPGSACRSMAQRGQWLAAYVYVGTRRGLSLIHI